MISVSCWFALCTPCEGGAVKCRKSPTKFCFACFIYAAPSFCIWISFNSVGEKDTKEKDQFVKVPLNSYPLSPIECPSSSSLSP